MGGHGIFAYDGSNAPTGTGIVYRCENKADVVTDFSGNYTKYYSYDLISVDWLWDRRYDQGTGKLFDAFGCFDGDTYKQDACHAPWEWDDPDDGPTYTGMNFSDPAFFIDSHFSGLGSFSHKYIVNPYYSHRITITSIKSKQNNDGLFNSGSDLFVRVFVGDDDFVDNRMWKKDNAEIGVNYPVNWGKDQSDSINKFSEDFNTIYVIKPHNSQIKIQVYDHDSSSGHDFMGELLSSPTPNTNIKYNQTPTSNKQSEITAEIYANTD